MSLPPTVLVLAAGRGERFLASGGRTHKLDALLGGRSVLAQVLQAVADSGLPHHVVQPQGALTAGMGDSIAAGVRATPEAAGWLILPADLPLVQAQTLRQVAMAPDSPVTVPVYQGQRGHPVRFAAHLGPALMQLSGDRGASAIVQAQAAHGGVQELPVDDEGCVLDVDTVQALQRAQALWQARQSAAQASAST